ncbi:hypothetical protein CVT26_003528 [Gymnopilus dilepis]|uniref:Uncharacterized protein n=1 Tax=Gymnopilus dilepis TaxID=231916 RepID=A0A409WR36_9AGAR|nr:hypothetical protein CVT26_003528 [Gymnopilus dilepis]
MSRIPAQSFPNPSEYLPRNPASTKGLFFRALSKFKEDVPSNDNDYAKIMADREEKAKTFERIIEVFALVVENIEAQTNNQLRNQVNSQLNRIHAIVQEFANAKGSFSDQKYNAVVAEYMEAKSFYEVRSSTTAARLQACLDEQWAMIMSALAINLNNPAAFRQRDMKRIKRSLSLSSLRNANPDVPSSVRGSSEYGTEMSHGTTGSGGPDVPLSPRSFWST